MATYWETVKNYKLQFPELSTAVIRTKIKNGELSYDKPKVVRALKNITHDYAINFLMEKMGYTKAEAIEYYVEHEQAVKNTIMRMKKRPRKLPIYKEDVEGLVKRAGFSKKDAEQYVATRAEKLRINKINEAIEKEANKKAKAEQRKKEKNEIKYHNDEEKGVKKARSKKMTNEIISRLISMPKVKKTRASKK